MLKLAELHSHELDSYEGCDRAERDVWQLAVNYKAGVMPTAPQIERLLQLAWTGSSTVGWYRRQELINKLPPELQKAVRQAHNDFIMGRGPDPMPMVQESLQARAVNDD